MRTQRLREKIADTYRSFSFWQDKQSRSVAEFEAKFTDCADQILALPEIAILDEDHSLPIDPSYREVHDRAGYKRAQQDMLKQGWKKVIDVIPTIYR